MESSGALQPDERKKRLGSLCAEWDVLRQAYKDANYRGEVEWEERPSQNVDADLGLSKEEVDCILQDLIYERPTDKAELVSIHWMAKDDQEGEHIEQIPRYDMVVFFKIIEDEAPPPVYLNVKYFIKVKIIEQRYGNDEVRPWVVSAHPSND